MFKKSVIIFLLPLYLLTSLGSLTPYWTILHQASYRLRVRRGEFKKLTTFSFTAQEYETLEWERRGEEFEYGGKMYDVASIEKTAEGYTIKCKHDQTESLIRRLLEGRKNKQKNSNSKKRPTLKYTSEFINGSAIIKPNILSSLKRQYIGLHQFYKTISQDIESPPPELG